MRRIAFCVLALIASQAAMGADEPAQRLDADSQALKREILQFDSDLRVLEERTLAPAPARITVFLSMDLGIFFKPETVQLELDGKELVNHQYEGLEVDALIKGATQELWVGRAPTGPHELVAILTGIGPHQREIRRAVSLNFDQWVDAYGRYPRPRKIELRIADGENRQEPDFQIKDWP